jgi:hypothetical protein
MIVAVGLFWETQAQKASAFTLWTIPRYPIPSHLCFSLTRKAYSILLGDLRSTGAVWTVVDFLDTRVFTVVSSKSPGLCARQPCPAPR